MEDFFDDLAKRDERVRYRTYNEKEYCIKCTDPYGFWHIVAAPKNSKLTSSFTSANEAFAAIEAYEEALDKKEQAAIDKIKAGSSKDKK